MSVAKFNNVARSAFWPISAVGFLRSVSTIGKVLPIDEPSLALETKVEDGTPPASEKDSKRDRSKTIPVETSIRYLKSASYKEAYGETLVWEQYRRNHKGMFPPRNTRKTCIRKGSISTGNPCPICRDEYLVLDHRNTDLLKQFISTETGEVLSYSKTGVCQKKHQELLVAVERAHNYGYLTFDAPFREFNYSEYYNNKGESKK